ncbi:alginate export family protein [Azospirillum brasilense]|nr:alginate export family protein [Azospirillum brasilense]
MRRWRGALVAALLLQSAPAPAETPVETPPPPLTNSRYDEDYRYLLDPAAGSGAFWERFKAIPLTPGGTVSLSTGLEARLRGEAVRNSGWGQDEPRSDAYGLWRLLPYADLRVGPALRVFGQLIMADTAGKLGPEGAPDVDRADLLQGFADLSVPLGSAQGTLRAGRQMLAYGSERLISLRYGANVPRAFDAVTGIVQSGPWRVDGFLGRPVRAAPDLFDDRRDGGRSAWGLYATRGAGAGWGTGLDAYYIGYGNRAASFEGGQGREERHTLGTRLFGKADGWDWNWEAMLQTGRIDGDTIAAWSVASDTGHRWDGVPLRPRLGLKANIASGDRDPGDGRLGTFNPLFPRAKYFGELTPVGPLNLMNLHPSVDLALSDEFSLSASAIAYWRMSLGDGVYDLSGNLLRDGAGSRSRYIGTQGELVLSYAAGRTVEGLLSYSLFRPGSFLQDTGPAKTIHFVGVEAVFKF